MKVKRDPVKVAQGTPSPAKVLARRLPKATERLAHTLARLPDDVTASVVQGSADRIMDWVGLGRADLIVTSPPYINAMNYPMTTRYEMLLLGSIPPADMHSHERTYYGSERVSAQDYRDVHSVPASWSSAAYLNAAIESVHAGEPKRAYIVYKYFTQMNTAIGAMLDAVRPGGHVVLVCGTNRVKGVSLDTSGRLVGMATDRGASVSLTFSYELFRQRLKLTRHSTAGLIGHDTVTVLRKP